MNQQAVRNEPRDVWAVTSDVRKVPTKLLGPGTKMCYVELVSVSQGGVAEFTALETGAAQGVGDRAIRKHLDKLEAVGLISVEPQRFPGLMRVRIEDPEAPLLKLIPADSRPLLEQLEAIEEEADGPFGGQKVRLSVQRVRENPSDAKGANATSEGKNTTLEVPPDSGERRTFTQPKGPSDGPFGNSVSKNPQVTDPLTSKGPSDCQKVRDFPPGEVRPYNHEDLQDLSLMIHDARASGPGNDSPSAHGPPPTIGKILMGGGKRHEIAGRDVAVAQLRARVKAAVADPETNPAVFDRAALAVHSHGLPMSILDAILTRLVALRSEGRIASNSGRYFLACMRNACEEHGIDLFNQQED